MKPIKIKWAELYMLIFNEACRRSVQNSVRQQFTTVVLKLHRSTPGKMDVIFFRCPFLLLFWASKKVKKSYDA